MMMILKMIHWKVQIGRFEEVIFFLYKYALVCCLRPLQKIGRLEERTPVVCNVEFSLLMILKI